MVCLLCDVALHRSVLCMACLLCDVALHRSVLCMVCLLFDVALQRSVLYYYFFVWCSTAGHIRHKFNAL